MSDGAAHQAGKPALQAALRRWIDEHQIELRVLAEDTRSVHLRDTARDGHRERADALLGQEATEHGVDEKVFLDLLLRKMRAVMMYRFVAEARKEMPADFPTEDMELIESLAKDATTSLTSRELAEVLRAYESVRVAVVPGLALELALLRIAGK